MKSLNEISVLVIAGLVIGGSVFLWNKFGETSVPTKKEIKPAVSHVKMTPAVNESNLNVLELSDDAIKRLGLETQPVTTQSMPRSRSYGAEMVLPMGGSVIVSAPLAGTLHHFKESRFPKVGQQVRAGENLLELLPMLTPERAVLTPAERIRFAEAKVTVAQTQIDAGAQFQQATVQVEAAQITLERAERLFRDNVGTKKVVDDAHAQLDLAKETLAAAKIRKQLVDNIKLDQEAGTLEPLIIESPLDGIIRITNVQSGQMISSGSPLFEVMNDSVMWIKVPVYVGEVQDIQMNQPARLTLLDGRITDGDVIAKPVSVPPTALSLSSTMDLYFEVPNPDHKFHPGQRVAAYLPLLGETEMKTVPWSAVMHDIYGGQWVYVQVDAHKYVRHRVEVGWVTQGRAALMRGPANGAQVVTAGVSELTGTEFGFAK